MHQRRRCRIQIQHTETGKGEYHMKLQPTRIALAVAMVFCGPALPAHAQQSDTKPADAAANNGQGQVEQITVTGIRASRQQSLAKKREADSVMDVVSAEDIGKLPDKNVAD